MFYIKMVTYESDFVYNPKISNFHPILSDILLSRSAFRALWYDLFTLCISKELLYQAPYRCIVCFQFLESYHIADYEK